MENYIINRNIYHSDELMHFGIKGMKWGVRRYQNKNGTLTPVGKKRYADDPTFGRYVTDVNKAKANKQSAKKALNKAYNDYNINPSKKTNDAYVKAAKDYQNASALYDVKKEAFRIKDKNITFENKSKHQQSLEDRYKKLGMSDEDAQAAASKKIRAERIATAAAAITVAGCALYIANEARKRRVDGVIKAGENLQRIEMKDTNGQLHDVFYMSKGSHDNKRYASMLGFTRQQQTGRSYMMQLAASKDIKVASQDKAVKAFEDLYKNDPDFAQKVRQASSRHFSGRNVISESQLNNPSNRTIKKMYDNFNSALVDPSLKNSGADKTFYNKLKSMGYGAIQDINDMKYSGYGAKNPLIVFDNSDNNIMVKSVSQMQKVEVQKAIAEVYKGKVDNYISNYGKVTAVAAAAGATINAVNNQKIDPYQQYLEDEKRKKGG